jgi:hypothetical protein
MVQSVQQWAMGWMAEAEFLEGIRGFPVLQSIQTGFKTHTAFCPVGTEGYFSRAQQPVWKVDNSFTSSTKGKNDAAIPPSPSVHGMV